MNSLAKKIWRFLTDDLPAKVFIFCLSLGLWFFVNVLAVDAISLTLPVHTENIPENREAAPIDRMRVQVRLRSRSALMDTNQIKAYIDLSAAKDGKGFYPVSLQGLPEGVFYSILPYGLWMDIDPYVSQKLPVVLQVQGADEKNYVIDYRWTPPAILVRAPSKAFRRLKEIRSEPLDIRRINHTQLTVPLSLQAPSNGFLSRSNAQVHLNLALERFTNVMEIPLTLSNLGDNLKVEGFPTLKAEFISDSANQPMLRSHITAFADASNLSPGKHKVAVTLVYFDEIISNRSDFTDIHISETMP